MQQQYRFRMSSILAKKNMHCHLDRAITKAGEKAYFDNENLSPTNKAQNICPACLKKEIAAGRGALAPTENTSAPTEASAQGMLDGEIHQPAYSTTTALAERFFVALERIANQLELVNERLDRLELYQCHQLGNANFDRTQLLEVAAKAEAVIGGSEYV